MGGDQGTEAPGEAGIAAGPGGRGREGTPVAPAAASPKGNQTHGLGHSPSPSGDWQPAPAAVLLWGRAGKEHTPGREWTRGQAAGHGSRPAQDTQEPSGPAMGCYQVTPRAWAPAEGARAGGEARGEVGMGPAGASGHHPPPPPRKCLCWALARRNSLVRSHTRSEEPADPGYPDAEEPTEGLWFLLDTLWARTQGNQAPLSHQLPGETTKCKRAEPSATVGLPAAAGRPGRSARWAWHSCGSKQRLRFNHRVHIPTNSKGQVPSFPNTSWKLPLLHPLG